MTRPWFILAVVVLVIGWEGGVPRPVPLRAQGQPPRRFEVASVKKNVSGENRMRMITQPGGRLTVTNAPLQFLVAVAFQVVDPEPLVRARVLGGPDWIESERYDIEAKAAMEFTQGPSAPPELLEMVRSLLEDRFKLRAHRDTREMPIYELVVARADRRLGPGMHKSDRDCDAYFAARRAGAPPPPRGPLEPPPCSLMGGPARTIAGAATMQQLAENLARRAERIVVDKTGLVDRFDFTLAFTPDVMPQGTPPPGVPPIDPNGPGLFTALQEQLGLKLSPAKGLVEVVVIDNLERLTPD